MKITDFMKIFSSERRLEMLSALLHEETKDTIKEHIPASTYAFTVNYLKRVGFVQEQGGDVCLTDKGRSYLIIFERFRESIDVLRRMYDAFPDHTIYFPEEFFTRLHEIGDFQMITSEPSDVLKPHRVFFEYIKKSKYVHGISPLLFPDYPEFFKNLADHMGAISLVVTEEIYNILSSYPIQDYDAIEIYVTRETPQIAAAVTEHILSIGFFYKSGNYDFTRDLISTSPKAVQFGRDLVDYYRTKSRRRV